MEESWENFMETMGNFLDNLGKTFEPYGNPEIIFEKSWGKSKEFLRISRKNLKEILGNETLEPWVNRKSLEIFGEILE
jgi:hypothetical protein